MNNNFVYNLTVGSFVVTIYGYVCSRYLVRWFIGHEEYKAFTLWKSLQFSLLPWLVFNLIGFGLKSSNVMNSGSNAPGVTAIFFAAVFCLYNIRTCFQFTFKKAALFLAAFAGTILIGPMIFVYIISWSSSH